MDSDGVLRLFLVRTLDMSTKTGFYYDFVALSSLLQPST